MRKKKITFDSESFQINSTILKASIIAFSEKEENLLSVAIVTDKSKEFDNVKTDILIKKTQQKQEQTIYTSYTYIEKKY